MAVQSWNKVGFWASTPRRQRSRVQLPGARLPLFGLHSTAHISHAAALPENGSPFLRIRKRIGLFPGKKPIAAPGLPGARARACLRNCIRRRRRFTAESVRENRTTHRRGRGRASPSVAGNSAHPGAKAERMRLRLHCRIPQTLDRALPPFVACGVNRRGVELQSKQTRRDFWIR